MSDPWAAFRVQQQAPQAAPKPAPGGDVWAAYRTAVDNSPNELGVPVFNKPQSRADLAQNLPPSHVGTILPISHDAVGDAHFDMNAGIPGAIISALQGGGNLAKQAMEGGSQSLLNDPSVPGRALQAGSLGMPVNPAVRSGDMAVPGVANLLRNGKVAPPTAEELKAAGSAGFDKMRDLGVDYSSNSVKDAAAMIQAGLDKDGLISEVAPLTHSVLNKFKIPPDGSVVEISGLHAARKALGKVAMGKDKTDAGAAKAAIKKLDGYLGDPGPKGVVAGPAAEVKPLLDEANANYAAGSRSSKLNNIEESADLGAAAANSGQNLDNSVRSRVKSLLEPGHPERLAGFSEKEVDALRQVARGSATRNTTRWVGNFLGGGGGLGAQTAGAVGGAIGGVLGGFPGAGIGAVAAPAAGMIAKKVANRMTEKALQGVDELVRTRSPLYQKMLREAPNVAPGTPEWKALMTKAILAEQAKRRGDSSGR